MANNVTNLTKVQQRKIKGVPKPVLTESVFIFKNKFETILPEMIGEYLENEKVDFRLDSPYRFREVEIKLHIFWDRKEYALDLNNLFNLDHNLVRIEQGNLFCNSVLNGIAMQQAFEWVSGVVQFATEQLMTHKEIENK